MLTKLKLHNFRTFLNADFTLQRRHLIIGKNNSGKTNLTRGIRFLGATAATDLNSAAAAWIPGGIPEARNWNLKSDLIELRCTCELDFEGDPCEFTYDLVLKIAQQTGAASVVPPGLRVEQEQLSLSSREFADTVLLKNDGREATMLHEEQHAKGDPEPYTPKTLSPQDATMLSKLYELDTNRRAILFRRFLSGWNYYALNPEAMRLGMQTPSTLLTPLDPRGDRLANAIFHLKNFDEMRYRKLIDHVRLIEPDLQAINFVATPDQGAVPFVARRNKSAASWGGLSDGTLRALAIAYIVETNNIAWPQASTLSIIEEPENGIYPGLLRTLFDLFEERAPEGQFIFTSHSPFFIDLFDGERECVTLLRRNEDRTEILSTPLEPDDESSDRLTLAEKYAAELIG